MAEYQPKSHIVLVANGEPPTAHLFHSVLYPNNLKSRNFGCVKAPGLIDRKQPHISNIESVTIDQARDLSRQPKSDFSSCLGITPLISLIAVDGGFKSCHTYQRIPELVLGDFDSIEEKLLKNYPTIKVIHTPDQNKTDLEKAFEYLFQFSIEQITVLGALGRQIDHTYKNLELLTRYPTKVTYQTPYEKLFSLPKKSTFLCKKGTKISFIPFGNKVTNITSRGLKWELIAKDLKEMSISNVALQEKIFIEFETGHLLCALASGE